MKKISTQAVGGTSDLRSGETKYTVKLRKLSLVVLALLITLGLTRMAIAQTYTLGVVNNVWRSESPDAKQLLEKVLATISKKTGDQYTLVSFNSNNAILAAIKQKQLDLAFVGYQVYEHSKPYLHTKIVAMALSKDHETNQLKTTSDVYLVSNKPFAHLQDAKGSILLLGDRLSTSLYRLPTQFFKENHIQVNHFFSQVINLKTQKEIISRLETSSEAIVAPVWSAVYWNWDNHLKNLTILQKIPGMKNSVIIAVKPLPEAMLKKFQAALMQLDAQDLRPINLEGFHG